jgi:hypothetical protein
MASKKYVGVITLFLIAKTYITLILLKNSIARIVPMAVA